MPITWEAPPPRGMSPLLWVGWLGGWCPGRAVTLGGGLEEEISAGARLTCLLSPAPPLPASSSAPALPLPDSAGPDTGLLAGEGVWCQGLWCQGPLLRVLHYVASRGVRTSDYWLPAPHSMHTWGSCVLRFQGQNFLTGHLGDICLGHRRCLSLALSVRCALVGGRCRSDQLQPPFQALSEPQAAGTGFGELLGQADQQLGTAGSEVRKTTRYL